MPSRYRIGIDIGGTFTDASMVDLESGAVWRAKRLGQPDAPSVPIRAVVQDLLDQSRADVSQVESVIHASTLVANTLIERKGVDTALVTTEGFRDVLELGNDVRYDIYDLDIVFPTPLVPRRRRFGMAERTAPTGTIELEPDASQVSEIARDLKRVGIQAVAVSLLHSYRNPANERRVKELLSEALPDADICLSSEIAPEIREYERTSTVVANAYVRRIVQTYLDDLIEAVRSVGISAPLFVMLSNGGVTSAQTAGLLPVRLVESGPAAGVLGARYHGGRVGQTRLIAFDVGGTTAKICFVDGEPAFTDLLEVARVKRHQPGSGLPLQVPSVELVEIGAGGGSIARVGETSLLQVGPESAGAAPGPVCYGRGGQEPTVTDADLVLGFLDPDYFLGGRMELDIAGARRSLASLGSALALDDVETAAGIHEIVNNNMAIAMRLHAAERGEDPSQYSLFAFGGAGPVHAYEVARLLGIQRIMCPAGAGTASATGLLVAPLSVDIVRSYQAALGEIDWTYLDHLQAEMLAEAQGLLDGAPVEHLECTRSVDLRYVGQGFEVTAPLGDEELCSAGLDELIHEFERLYARRHSATPLERSIEAVTWRLRATATKSEVELATPLSQSNTSSRRARDVYFADEHGFVRTPVYQRGALKAGSTFAGPAIVEEVDSTIVIGPRSVWHIDQDMNVVIDLPDTKS